MTQSTPRTLSGRPSEQAQFEAELASWLDFVSRATRKRLRLEKLITARGILKPVTLAQRFVIKSREVGFIPTVKLVNTRLRQMKQSDQ